MHVYLTSNMKYIECIEVIYCGTSADHIYRCGRKPKSSVSEPFVVPNKHTITTVSIWSSSDGIHAISFVTSGTLFLFSHLFILNFKHPILQQQ